MKPPLPKQSDFQTLNDLSHCSHSHTYSQAHKCSAAGLRDHADFSNQPTSWKKRLSYNPLRTSPKKGVALLMAVTSLILMVYIATEVSKDSALEYVISANESNRLKAYYAARNSLDIALLRVKAYQQLSSMNIPAAFAQDLEQIWKFPFMWPLPVAEDASSFTKDDAEDAKKAALFQGQYEHVISDEGSKIDINDLISPSKSLQEITYRQLLNIFESKIENDNTFRDKYQSYNFEELINNIVDWMSPTNTSKNNTGDKRAAFHELNEDGKSDYPPNRGFRSIDEVRLVPKMTEEFFRLLEPAITIYGTKAINPNLASAAVLKSLDKEMTDEAVKEIITHRDDPNEGGPFTGESSEQCRNDFKTYVEGLGVRLSPEFDKLPFICNKITNFRIVATGRSGTGKGASQKKITVIVANIASTAETIKSTVAKEAQQQNSNQQQDGNQNNPNTNANSNSAGSKSSQKEPLPKGRPRIVYWDES